MFKCMYTCVCVLFHVCDVCVYYILRSLLFFTYIVNPFIHSTKKVLHTSFTPSTNLDIEGRILNKRGKDLIYSTVK